MVLDYCIESLALHAIATLVFHWDSCLHKVLLDTRPHGQQQELASSLHDLQTRPHPL